MPIFGRAASWTVATFVGAIVGAAITSYWNRGKPEFTFISFTAAPSSDPALMQSNRRWPTPPKLRELLTASVWSTHDDLRGDDDVTYKKLTEVMDSNEENMKHEQKAFERFYADEPRLRALLSQATLSEHDRGEVFDLWERNDELIYACIGGDFDRGTFKMTAQLLEGEPPPPLYVVHHKTKDGDLFLVHKRGGTFNSFLQATREEELPLSKYVAVSLSQVDKPALSAMLDDVRQAVDEGKKDTSAVTAEISGVRERFSKWNVELLATNPGGSAIAVLPYADLVVHSEKLMVDGNPYGKPMRIRLVRAGSDLETTQPMRLEPGSAEVVHFTSAKFLGDYHDEHLLLGAFRVGGADAELQVQTVVSGDPARHTFLTTSFRFARQQPEL